MKILLPGSSLNVYKEDKFMRFALLHGLEMRCFPALHSPLAVLLLATPLWHTLRTPGGSLIYMSSRYNSYDLNAR